MNERTDRATPESGQCRDRACCLCYEQVSLRAAQKEGPSVQEGQEDKASGTTIEVMQGSKHGGDRPADI